MAQDQRLPRPRAILTGTLAVAAALAAGHLVAGLLNPNASPFFAVGNTAIDLTPAGLKDFAVRTFGSYDKLVLLAAMALVLLGFAVTAGLISRRSPWPGVTLATALGALGIAAVLARPDLDALDVLAPLTSLVTGAAIFLLLHNGSQPSDPSRRRFLLTGAGILAAGATGQLLVRDVEDSRAGIGDITPRQPAPPIPSGADFAPQGTPRFLTANRDFYRVDTALTVPQLRAEDYVLRIHGAVDTELTLRFDDLRRRELVERTITMTCVSNEVGGPYTSTANFTGVPLRDLLTEAGVKPGAEQLFSTSIDGWTAGTPITDILQRGLLAIGMNGEPLPAEHGFPARIVVPGLYGYVSATKWVTDLELTTFAARQAYWQQRGWAQKAPVKTQSRIDSPTGFATVSGRTTITGVAWAQTRGIAKVEIRADNGPWTPTDLAAEVNPDTWRMWRTELDLSPGLHTVECRATDKTGHTQTGLRVPPIPDGATGWHSTTFTVY